MASIREYLKTRFTFKITSTHLMLGGVLFLCAACLGFLGYNPLDAMNMRWKQLHDPYIPINTFQPGPQLVFVYLGSAHCAYSNTEEMPEIIQGLKLAVKRHAEESGRSFRAVGIASNWIVDHGIEHLRKFGTFDEIMTGQSWLNTGSLKYIWKDLPGHGATPQVLVVERVVETPFQEHRQGQGYMISEEKLIVRVVGVEALSQWLANGVALPSSEKAN